MNTAGGEPPRFGGSWRPKNKKQLEKWKKDASSSTTVKAVTLLAEEVIPPEAMLTSSGISAVANRDPRRSRKKRSHRITNKQEDQRLDRQDEGVDRPGVALDGFMLLEHCLVDLPDEATRADLQGKGIRTIVQDDMTLFTSLAYLNLAENEVNMKCCESFPALQ